MRQDEIGHGVAEDYDPFGKAHLADPHAFWTRARRERPVFHSDEIGAWVVSRYDDALAVLKDHRRFGIAIYRARTSSLTPETLAILATNPVTARSLIEIDPPGHTRLRGAITRALSAQRVAAMEPRIRALAGALIDEFAPLGRADLQAAFADRLPVMVIGCLIDVPEADLPQLLRWAWDRVALLFGEVPPDAQPALARGSIALTRYIQDLALSRQENPGDDLASDLMRAVAAGEAPLDAQEAAAMLRTLYFAGFETTVRLLGACVLRLLADRRRWQALLDDPGSIPAVVEESLRMDGSVMATVRVARETVELGGATIPEGALVHVVLCSADRDEAAFTDAASFHPGRDRTVGHLAFGFGVHFCVGAPLARLQMRVALEELVRRLPALRLVAGQDFRYAPSLLLRGPQQVLVEW
jgi:cytochrome P450